MDKPLFIHFENLEQVMLSQQRLSAGFYLNTNIGTNAAENEEIETLSLK